MPNKTALIIESDSAFAAQLASALTSLGLESQILSDGAEGLAHAKDLQPSLIALCVELPKMSGYAVCNKLKKSNRLKDVPLIIMSADATPETFEQHRKLKTRADEYILKGAGFSMATFLEKVEAIMPPEGTELNAEDLLLEDDLDLSFANDHTGVDAEMLAETNAALDSLGADEDFDVDVEQAVASGLDQVVEEEILGDAPSIESASLPDSMEEESDDLDLGLDELANTAAAEAARPAPSAASTNELASLRKESDRLREELASYKAGGGAKVAASDRDREFLNLRGVINTKEKEILDLKDQLTARDRELLDGRDKIAKLERARQDLDSQNLELESLRVELNEQLFEAKNELNEAQSRIAELDGAVSEGEKTIGAHTERIASLEGAMVDLEARRAQEAEAAAAALEEAATSHTEETQRLRDRQTGELLRLKEEREAALAEKDSSHAEALASLENEHARQVEALHAAGEARLEEARAAHDGQIASLKSEHQEALDRREMEAKEAMQAAETRRVEELAAAEEKLAQAEAGHATALETLKAEHESAGDELRGQMEAGVAKLKAEHQATMDELRGQMEAGVARLKAEHAAAHDALRAEHAAGQDALRAEHAAALQALADEHQTAMDELRGQGETRVAKLEAEHANAQDALGAEHAAGIQALKNEHQAAMDELRGQHVSMVSSLEGRILETEDGRDAALARAGKLEDELQKTQTALGDSEARTKGLEQDVAAHREQIGAAVDRMEADRAVVANTKKALVVALTLLEEQFQDAEDAFQG